MKNLGRTVDRILKVEPDLEPRLIPIKNRWEKGSGKATYYWKQLISVLNNEIDEGHPNRDVIQDILSSKKTPEKKQRYTFRSPEPTETVLGVIPEDLECQLKKNDRAQIELSKRALEAQLTHDMSLALEVARSMEYLDIRQKKIWAELKDRFNLWKSDGPATFFVRENSGLLVMTALKNSNPGSPSNRPNQGEPMPDTFILRMDSEMLKRFFQYFNITPPPGLL